ncbi:MAG: hypothetical protein ACI9WC_002960, partial [Arenicella sp.]
EHSIDFTIEGYPEFIREWGGFSHYEHPPSGGARVKSPHWPLVRNYQARLPCFFGLPH